ncbi:uncharacterized protein LOC128040514 [Gossypium raimondii]|uniref:uncharacterized protein LOC128040514 n=1 Tax=Gossypium raimondii TaxID=29730 RepID=UPI00227A99CF|nr:uncharacterized protein LOC128040514 [Gossypium raimondii]
MATENTLVQPAIPKFDGHYDHWAMLIENFLRSKEYWSLVETEISVAPNKYQGSTRVKRAQLQVLRKEFDTLHMKVGETVNDYFARTLTIANKMKANAKNKSDKEVVEKILRSMTTKFNYVVCSIDEAQDTNNLSIDELQSSLLVHEQMIIIPEEEQVLKVTYGESSTRGRGRGGYRGRGHFQWECQSKESNHTENSEEMLLMVWVGQLESDNWFLDSGCSNHMCNRKEYFTDFNKQFADNVKLENDATLVVKEKGLVVLIQHNNYKAYHPDRGVIVMSLNRMFKIATLSLPSGTTCFNTITEDVGQLWNCRNAHLSFNGLNTL